MLHDALRVLLVVDVGDVVEAEASRTLGRNSVLAAHRDRYDLGSPAGMAHVELAATLYELVEAFRQKDMVKIASNHRDGLITLSYLDSRNSLAIDSCIGEGALIIERVHAKAEHGTNARVVVVLRAQMAVGAGLRFARTDRVRGIRCHGRVGEARRGNKGLLVDHVVAVAIEDADDRAAGRTEWPHLASLVVRADAEEVEVRTDGVLIVGSVGAREFRIGVQVARLNVDLKRHVATRTGGLPRGTARETFHFAIPVREVAFRGTAGTHRAVP